MRVGGRCRGSSSKSSIVLRRSKLLHDIENLAYVEGHVMDKGNIEAVHTTQDIAQRQTGGLSRVEQLLSVAHKIVVEMLHPMTRMMDVDRVVTDDAWRPEEYRIELNVPEGFSNTTLHLLAGWVHEYMVYRVLWDWLSITAPERAENWRLHMEEAAREIERAKNRRGGVTRRRLSPF